MLQTLPLNKDNLCISVTELENKILELENNLAKTQFDLDGVRLLNPAAADPRHSDELHQQV